MKLNRLFDVTHCDECECWGDVYELTLNDGFRILRLCPKCIVKLLKEIVERD